MRVASPESIVTSRQPFTSGRTRWVVYDLSRMKVRRTTTILALLLLVIGSASARKRHHQPAQNSSSKFDSYLLSLSWAPNYCANHLNDNSTECRQGQHTGFVLHGLWPQSHNSPPPENCGSARPVAQSIVREMLAYFPSAGLIQHEWATHGTCSGLPAGDYFAKAAQAFRSVRVPDQYKSPDQQRSFRRREIEQSFADVNHASDQ